MANQRDRIGKGDGGNKGRKNALHQLYTIPFLDQKFLFDRGTKGGLGQDLDRLTFHKPHDFASIKL